MTHNQEITSNKENSDMETQQRCLLIEKRIQKYENQFYMQEQRLLKVEKVSDSIAEAV